MNWFMPAFVNSSVGSLAGTSDEECTRRCPFVSKNRRKSSRIWLPDLYTIDLKFSSDIYPLGSPGICRHAATAPTPAHAPSEPRLSTVLEILLAEPCLEHPRLSSRTRQLHRHEHRCNHDRPPSSRGPAPPRRTALHLRRRSDSATAHTRPWSPGAMPGHGPRTHCPAAAAPRSGAPSTRPAIRPPTAFDGVHLT